MGGEPRKVSFITESHYRGRTTLLNTAWTGDKKQEYCWCQIVFWEQRPRAIPVPGDRRLTRSTVRAEITLPWEQRGERIRWRSQAWSKATSWHTHVYIFASHGFSQTGEKWSVIAMVLRVSHRVQGQILDILFRHKRHKCPALTQTLYGPPMVGKSHITKRKTTKNYITW